MDKYNIKKYLIVLICISFISMISFDFISLHKHDKLHCNKTECSLCTHIEQTQNILRSLHRSNSIFSIGILLVFFQIEIFYKWIVLKNDTPISLKVRMDN
ncbi:MAG: hypothetical protein ACRC92_05030 [Peptostreptococcaceae bacterium]